METGEGGFVLHKKPNYGLVLLFSFFILILSYLSILARKQAVNPNAQVAKVKR